MPETDGRLHARVRSETLRTALNRMVTTKSEPGVTFTFRRGNLTLESRAKESGQSKAAIPVAFNDTWCPATIDKYSPSFLGVL